MIVYIVTPSGSVTGGPECLHQFGQALRLAGGDARMVYVPDRSGAGAAEHYSHYGVPPAERVLDGPDNVVVVPELMTAIAREFPKSRKAVYWLSVDNYFYRKRESYIVDVYRRFRSLFGSRLSLRGMRGYEHISQSYYASEFLQRHKLRGMFVGDYLNDEFFQSANEALSLGPRREDFVAYNPAKGSKYAESVMQAFPHLRFVPIRGMTRAEVIGTFSRAKVYLDLGQHPGKDRMPREAATLGCCILTSRRGSAGNSIDLPIPDEYKFDLNRRSARQIGRQIERVFQGYEIESEKFAAYRSGITHEKTDFLKNSARWLQHISLSENKGQTD